MVVVVVVVVVLLVNLVNGRCKTSGDIAGLQRSKRQMYKL